MCQYSEEGLESNPWTVTHSSCMCSSTYQFSLFTATMCLCYKRHDVIMLQTKSIDMGLFWRLYTSIHSFKPKLKSKVAILESIPLNEGPRNTLVSSPTALLPCQTNMRIIFKIQVYMLLQQKLQELVHQHFTRRRI